MLTDWIQWSYDCKGQNLLLKDVSHQKSSGAEKLIIPVSLEASCEDLLVPPDESEQAVRSGHETSGTT
ncbi:hypothetical protein AOLI_G00147470 [Acnodon oligacanthus]